MAFDLPGCQAARLPGQDLPCSVGLLNRTEDGAWRSSGNSELSTVLGARTLRLTALATPRRQSPCLPSGDQLRFCMPNSICCTRSGL